ncbi:DUF4401 domain-containing protein [Flagellimonas nanhaiensis]|uniref:DUF4401 domain-containing protein n=1 Tax=Flagellimonas nanhaiensis TaxID=2292706 RepID=A0A371JQT4_9FLAO|nr:DUF4401 domain-containing protein [Allomuricauda nanhaiensis]RDY59793.1 DUF4401 domain-containing protein [Allomuricauda nanhaiensis]
MEKLKELIQQIHVSEGGHFMVNEETLFAEYGRKNDQQSSLAIKVLSIFGGILASLTFLGFLAIAGIYDSTTGLLVVGITFLILAIWLNRLYQKVLIDTFSICVYLIGISLIIFALADLKVNEDQIAQLCIFIALCCLFLSKSYMLSFISMLIVSICFLVLIISNDVYDFIHLYVWVYACLLVYFFLNEADLIKYKLYDPVRVGLLFSLLFGLIAIGKEGLMPINPDYIWVSSLVSIISILYLVGKIVALMEADSLKFKGWVYLLTTAALLPTFFAPSISGALLIMLLCFLVNYKTGFAVGIIALVYFVAQYYYDLNFTLLTKSIILFSSGIVLLLFYLFLTKKFNAHEKV